MEKILLCACFLFSSFSFVQAQEGPNAKSTGESLSKVTEHKNTIRAQILAVDTDKGEVKVEETVTGNNLRLKVADRTTLSSFQKGDNVRIILSPNVPQTAINIVADK